MARKKKQPVEDEEEEDLTPYEDESAFDELMENPRLPQMRGGDGPMETSYDKALNILTVTEDEGLEIMTRATPISAKASAVAYSMCFTFRSRYTKGRIDQINRLAVSMGGKGREEIVSSLSANSGAFEIPGGDMGGADSSPFMPASEE